MNKTIEHAFFGAFELGGVVNKGFDWMRQKYDLGFKFSKEDGMQPPKALPNALQLYYNDTLPKRINELTSNFDASVLDSTDSSLMNEIANNLDSLTGKDRDAYIFSLLKPFKEYSDNVHPIAVIKRLNGEVNGICGIKDFERDLAMWENMPLEEPIKNICGKASGTPGEQADACRKAIQDYKYQIERANYIANRYCDLLGKFEDRAAWMQEGTVENCMSLFFSVIHKFSNRLDALLLERGINLLWYQQESGIYLTWHRCVTDLEYYIGSLELVNKYIREALPKLGKEQNCSQRVETESNDVTNNSHFSVNKSYKEMLRVLTALQKQEFVSSDTTIETFYYRMTGNGEPVQGHICWVKKAKNKSISLTSLIDFLVTIGVELESALSQVDDVFCREDGGNIKLPDDTKTTARKKNRNNQDLSAYHQVIKTIIDEE